MIWVEYWDRQPFALLLRKFMLKLSDDSCQKLPLLVKLCGILIQRSVGICIIINTEKKQNWEAVTVYEDALKNHQISNINCIAGQYSFCRRPKKPFYPSISVFQFYVWVEFRASFATEERTCVGDIPGESTVPFAEVVACQLLLALLSCRWVHLNASPHKPGSLASAINYFLSTKYMQLVDGYSKQLLSY